MASIFANSHLTIIAVDGDCANYGLRGLRGISESRAIDQKIHNLTSRLRVASVPYLDESGKSVWGTRGWTFQEHIFSTRRLRFEKQLVHWECDYDAWNEEQGHVKEVDLRRARDLSAVFALPFPSISGCGKLLNKYSTRVLTYPEDSLFAFSGITTALSRVFQGGFLAGLPLMFLDIALLWEPAGVSKRRRPLMNSEKNPCLPSWSWVGWEGEVSVRNWEVASCYIRKSDYSCITGSNSLNRVIPILQWSVSEDLNTVKIPVRNSWEQHKCLYLEKTRPTPAGWTRHECSKEDYISWNPPQVSKGNCSYFTHDRLPKTQFWFPIPITVDNPHPPVCSTARYLHCKTQRARLWKGKICWLDNIYTKYTSVMLYEKNANWAGVLRLYLKNPASYKSQPDTLIELIALSQGFAYYIEGNDQHFEEFHVDKSLRSKGIYNFYNVMWIEWENGIAYRKAIGRVLKTTWEQQELEWIDVTLG